jgi:CheY-like chemotaxis protein
LLSATVEDTGHGLTDAEIKRLFEPFSQAKGALNTQEGTGLGLAISRKYARLMGGDITVKSTPGEGSVFRFEIPVERGDPGVIKQPAIRRVLGLSPGANAPKILIADDQPENRDWLTKLLTSIGFSVRGVENGEAAVQSCAEWKPRLILMDVHMPVMGGLEATRRIKTDPSTEGTLVVALTASAMNKDREEAARFGADDFITKPCQEDELLEKMRVLLDIAYEYEDVGEPQDAAVSSATDHENKLEQMPAELIEQLHDAVMTGNKRRLDQLIARVRESEDATAANILQGLADKYDYDTLTQLLQAGSSR